MTTVTWLISVIDPPDYLSVRLAKDVGGLDAILIVDDLDGASLVLGTLSEIGVPRRAARPGRLGKIAGLAH